MSKEDIIQIATALAKVFITNCKQRPIGVWYTVINDNNVEIEDVQHTITELNAMCLHEVEIQDIALLLFKNKNKDLRQILTDTNVICEDVKEIVLNKLQSYEGSAVSGLHSIIDYYYSVPSADDIPWELSTTLYRNHLLKHDRLALRIALLRLDDDVLRSIPAAPILNCVEQFEVLTMIIHYQQSAANLLKEAQ